MAVRAFTVASGVTLSKSGSHTLWPGVAGQLIAILSLASALVVLVPIGVLVARALLRRPAHDSPHRSLGKFRDVLPMTPTKAAVRAKYLRPSLAGVKVKDITDPDRGYVLGQLAPRNKVRLFGSFEDVALAFIAPRSMKTTALAIPIVLDAPGAVVATEQVRPVGDHFGGARAVDRGAGLGLRPAADRARRADVLVGPAAPPRR